MFRAYRRRMFQCQSWWDNRLILLAILFLGLFLRIYDIGKESIWVDEGYSIKVANLNLFQMLVETTKEDYTPPLYYAILHFWVNLFGNSEFSVRFPSVIFGFFAIFMIYKVGSLIFDKEVGILSSLILSLSVFHIYYSQEARSYSLTVLMTLLSFYFFIKLLKERSLMVSIGYILSSMFLTYTHNFDLFIIIAQNIYVVTLFLLSKEVHKLNFKRWILLQLILILQFTPYVGFFISKTMEIIIQHQWALPEPSVSSIIGSFTEYSGSRLLWLLFVILSFFSIINCEKIGGSISWRDSFKSIQSYCFKIGFSNLNEIYLLLVWLLIPIILPFLISRFSTHVYLTRYMIAASLALYLLVAKGIRNINSKYIKLAIISIIIILCLRASGYYYTNIHKAQWREVASYIDTNAKPNDLIVFNFYPDQKWCFDYYSKRTDLIKKTFVAQPKREADENIKELLPIAKGYNRIWYIRASEGNPDDKELIKQTLSESYNQSYYKRDVGIEIYMYSPKRSGTV